jgi:hypothetical protein
MCVEGLCQQPLKLNNKVPPSIFNAPFKALPRYPASSPYINLHNSLDIHVAGLHLMLLTMAMILVSSTVISCTSRPASRISQCAIPSSALGSKHWAQIKRSEWTPFQSNVT